MPEIRAFPGDVIELQARNKALQDPSLPFFDGFKPSVTDLLPATLPGRKVKWSSGDVTLAELFETSPDGHRTKVKVLETAAPPATVTITAETDEGTFDHDIDIVAKPVPILSPDAIRDPLPLRPDYS